MHTLPAKLSSRWLLLGLANLCANATAYEMAHTVQLDEAGLAQPQPEAKLGQRRPVGARSMAAVFLSISAALLVTFVMLQCFRFLQRSENNDFLARRLAKGGEDPCKGDEEEEEYYAGIPSSRLFAPYIGVVTASPSKLRNININARGIIGPVQSAFSDQELIRFWRPQTVYPEEEEEEEEFAGFKRSDLTAADLGVREASIQELRAMTIRAKGVDKPVQNRFSDAELIRFWKPERILFDDTKDEEYFAGIPRSRLLAQQIPIVSTTPKKLRQLDIRARGINGPVQSAFSDRELIRFWDPEDIDPDEEDDEEEEREEEFAGFKRSDLTAADLGLRAASMQELRAMTIRAKGVDEPVQSRFSDAELIRFWKPERILFDDEENENKKEEEKKE